MFYYERDMRKSLERTYEEIDTLVKNSGVRYKGYQELRRMIIKWVNSEKGLLQEFYERYGVLWATGSEKEFAILVRTDEMQANDMNNRGLCMKELRSITSLLCGVDVKFNVDPQNGKDSTDIVFHLEVQNKS